MYIDIQMYIVVIWRKRIKIIVLEIGIICVISIRPRYRQTYVADSISLELSQLIQGKKNRN